jgi:glycosyltransferase involved in cell wall biosynthesis
MRCCLVVTTHERPRALARVLDSLTTQTRRPDELIVADDGSGPATAELVRSFAASARYTVRHAWQPHDGFRAGRIRNEALARSESEYVILLDGDMVMHPEFVADHLALARPGYYSQGVRVLLDEGATRRLEQPGSALPGPWSNGLGTRRRAYLLRSPALARQLGLLANHLVAVKACNQGFWRSDLLAANGFDEEMTGWGYEDKELCARLEHAGVRRQTLLGAAIALHLAHAPAARTQAEANRRRLEQTRRLRRTRCESGISQHAHPG